MDAERTTRELIETLGEDYDRCYRGILKSFDDGMIDAAGNLDADYEFHARQLVRAAFAYIEGVSFSVKASAAWKCMQDGIEITLQERYIAAEVEYKLNDKGEVVERPAQITLTRNIRFTFALTEKAHKIPAQFDPSVEWWSCLREAIKVRDRLMHPRMPEDLDISPEELIKTIKSKNVMICARWQVEEGRRTVRRTATLQLHSGHHVLCAVPVLPRGYNIARRKGPG